MANGFWWNPNQPGLGYVLEQRGNSVLTGISSYTAKGAPNWAIAEQPASSTSGVYSGQLFQYAGGAALGADFAPANQTAATGTAKLTLATPTSGTLELPTGKIPVQRYEFVTGAASLGQVAGYPETGWWWNPAQPGTGIFIEVQGTTLLTNIYSYDGSGNAIWYVSQGAMTDAKAYSGSLQVCALQPGFGVGCSKANLGSKPFSITFESTLAGTLNLPTGTAWPSNAFDKDLQPKRSTIRAAPVPLAPLATTRP